MRRFLLSAIFLLSSLSVNLAHAQSAPLSNPKNLPIETHLNLGFLSLFGGTMEYSLNGRRITSYQDFKHLIYPLGDAEASNEIRVAEQMDFVSWVIYGGSIVVGADVALFFKPVPFVNDDGLNRIATGFFVAQLGIGVWSLCNASAEARKFNAVQRYNKVLRKKTTASFELSPEIYASQNGMGLGLKTVF